MFCHRGEGEASVFVMVRVEGGGGAKMVVCSIISVALFDWLPPQSGIKNDIE